MILCLCQPEMSWRDTTLWASTGWRWRWRTWPVSTRTCPTVSTNCPLRTCHWCVEKYIFIYSFWPVVLTSPPVGDCFAAGGGCERGGRWSDSPSSCRRGDCGGHSGHAEEQRPSCFYSQPQGTIHSLDITHKTVLTTLNAFSLNLTVTMIVCVFSLVGAGVSFGEGPRHHHLSHSSEGQSHKSVSAVSQLSQRPQQHSPAPRAAGIRSAPQVQHVSTAPFNHVLI